MHHVVLDRWSRGRTFLHQRDARAKIGAALTLLVAIATARPPMTAFGCGCLALLLAAIVAGRLPLLGILWRASVALPFAFVFSAITWLSGDIARAEMLVVKAYLSALTALVLAALSPLPLLLNGMAALGAPRFLLLVAHFLYRYLFVLSEEGQHMRTAALSRGGSNLAAVRRAAAGALAVLFARSYERAESVHRAMLARGFGGQFRVLTPARFGAKDAVFLTVTAAGVAALWAATGGLR